jgi:hypothetical protein
VISPVSNSRVRTILRLACAVLPLGLVGCHSAFVQASVVNQTGQPIHLFEVDYPSASFGGGELASGATFRYRFKVLGSGGVKVTWTDAAEHEHTAQGPQLHEGQEGTLRINIGTAGAQWDVQLHDAHR